MPASSLISESIENASVGRDNNWDSTSHAGDETTNWSPVPGNSLEGGESSASLETFERLMPYECLGDRSPDIRLQVESSGSTSDGPSSRNSGNLGAPAFFTSTRGDLHSSGARKRKDSRLESPPNEGLLRSDTACHVIKGDSTAIGKEQANVGSFHPSDIPEREQRQKDNIPHSVPRIISSTSAICGSDQKRKAKARAVNHLATTTMSTLGLQFGGDSSNYLPSLPLPVSSKREPNASTLNPRQSLVTPETTSGTRQPGLHVLARAGQAAMQNSKKAEKSAWLDRAMLVLKDSCPVCWCRTGHTKSHSTQTTCYHGLRPPPEGWISSWSKLKSGLVLPHGQYCYHCGMPQDTPTQVAPACHRGQGFGKDRCPWSDIIYIVADIIWYTPASRTKLKLSFGLAEESTHSQFIEFCHRSDHCGSGEYFPVLEIFLWWLQETKQFGAIS